MRRQAGQKQAPVQDNTGKINDSGETAVTDSKHVSLHVVIVEEIYGRFAESLQQSASNTKINY